MIFDLNARSTLESVKIKWYSKLRHASINIPIILSGISTNDSNLDATVSSEIKETINIIKPIDFHLFTCSNLLQEEGVTNIFKKIASNALNFNRRFINNLMDVQNDQQAYLLLQKRLLGFSDITECNEIGENISHVFARLGFNESFHLLFRKAHRFSDEKYLDENSFIRILLQHQDNDGNTAIMTAALHHNYDIVQKFVWLQNDDWLSTLVIQNSKGQNLFDILFTQCSTGSNKELSAALTTQLFKKAVSFKSEKDQETMLVTKVFGMMKMIDILSEVNINIQLDDRNKTLRPFLLPKDENENIPIIAAAVNSIDSTAFEKLLIFYTNVDFSAATEVNSNGENFLHILGRMGLEKHIDVIRRVISNLQKTFSEENKEVNSAIEAKQLMTLLSTKSLGQTTPIVSAIISQNNNAFEKLLLFYVEVHFASLLIVDTNGWNLLHHLAQSENSISGMIEIFIRVVSDLEVEDEKKALIKGLNQEDVEGYTPLMLSANKGNQQSFEKLLMFYYKIDYFAILRKNPCGENFCHMMSKSGHDSLIDTLMENASKFNDENDFLTRLFLETDDKGNTPLMSAAINDKDSSLSKMLLFYYGDTEITELNEMMHHKNKEESTLLHIVASSDMMLGPYGTLLDFEKRIHMKTNDDYGGFLDLQKCLRESSGSSERTLKSLNMLKSTIPNSYMAIVMVYIKLLIGAFLFPLFVYFFDVVTDSYMVDQYLVEWKNETISASNQSLVNRVQSCNQTSSFLQDIPKCLSGESKSFYSITFIATPWIFYGYEFFQSDFYEALFLKVSETTEFITHSKTGRKLLIALFFGVMIPFLFICWPVIAVFRNFYYSLKHELSHGETKNNLHQIVLETSKTDGRARLLEASIEATFQPVLQWYLLYPTVIEIIVTKSSSFGQFTDNLIPYLSIISSIFSLAWAFTAYKANYKVGALDVLVAPVSRAILFLSDLLLIVARINCLILFMYSFGPGQFYPGVIFLSGHFVLIVILQNFFRDDCKWVQIKSHFIEYFHTSLLHGLANMFSNNGYVIMKSRQKGWKGKTFGRHLLYDLIFVAENITLSYYGYIVKVEPEQYQDAKNLTILISGGFHLIGLILKIVYYKKFHIWADLIQPFDLTTIPKKLPKTKQNQERRYDLHGDNHSISSKASSNASSSKHSDLRIMLDNESDK